MWGPDGLGTGSMVTVWALHGITWDPWDRHGPNMGLEWHIYGPSGHGFELGTQIWVLNGIFMGQVDMGLIWEHICGSCITYINGSCIAYLWAKWAWV